MTTSNAHIYGVLLCCFLSFGCSWCIFAKSKTTTIGRKLWTRDNSWIFRALPSIPPEQDKKGTTGQNGKGQELVVSRGDCAIRYCNVPVDRSSYQDDGIYEECGILCACPDNQLSCDTDGGICIPCSRCSVCSKYLHGNSSGIDDRIEAFNAMARDDPCKYALCRNCKKLGPNKYKCECAHTGEDPENDCLPCQGGWFGEGCKFSCGQCSTDNCSPAQGCLRCKEHWSPLPTCDKVDCSLVEEGFDPCGPTGRCVDSQCNCDVGYKPPTCRRKYRLSDPKPKLVKCQYPIACKNGGTCFMVEDEGYQVPKCLCPDGAYQADSKLRCSHNCKPLTSACVNGNCVHAKKCKCHIGWGGKSCDRPCKRNRYGRDCLEVCGECAITPCDRETGLCTGQACVHPRFKPPLCQTLADSQGLSYFINASDDANKILESEVESNLYYSRLVIQLKGKWFPAFQLRNHDGWEGWKKYVSNVTTRGCSLHQMICYAELENIVQGSVQLSTGVYARGKVNPGDVKSLLASAVTSGSSQVKAPSGYSFRSVEVIQVVTMSRAADASSNKLSDQQIAMAVGVAAMFTIIVVGVSTGTVCIIKRRKYRVHQQLSRCRKAAAVGRINPSTARTMSKG